MQPTSVFNSLALPLGALLMTLLSSCHPWDTRKQEPWGAALEPLVPQTEPPGPAPSYLRYRYSVVPGGIHNDRELAETLSADPVVHEHYADIDIRAVRFVRLEHDRDAFISYRVGNRIFWTRHRIHLPRGEEILSDGTHDARVRCGNRISDTPQAPVEPPAQTRDTTQFEPPTDPLPLRPVAIFHPGASIPVLPPRIFTPSTTIRFPAEPYLFPPMLTTLQPVPEPATYWLCISGIALLFFKSILTKRREFRARALGKV